MAQSTAQHNPFTTFSTRSASDQLVAVVRAWAVTTYDNLCNLLLQVLEGGPGGPSSSRDAVWGIEGRLTFKRRAVSDAILAGASSNSAINAAASFMFGMRFRH
jgi:hypothetical protein